MADPRVYKLKMPIQQGSETIHELSFRPPTAKDMRFMPHDEKKPLMAPLWLAGKLCGQPDSVIDKLTGEDLTEVVGIAMDFLPNFQRTGSSSSDS